MAGIAGGKEYRIDQANTEIGIGSAIVFQLPVEEKFMVTPGIRALVEIIKGENDGLFSEINL